MKGATKGKIILKINDQQHFKSIFNQTNKKLVVIDLHPQWVGPCEVMYSLFSQLAASIDDFKNRIDVIQVDIQKIPSFKSDKFCCTSKPKYLLAMEGRILHQVNGADLPQLQQLVKKQVPYI